MSYLLYLLNFPNLRNCLFLLNHFTLLFLANITPTVELNALAMKRGEPTSYKVIEHQTGNGRSNENTLIATLFLTFRISLKMTDIEGAF